MEEAHLQELIRKYIDGTASSAEREELLSWYRSSTNGNFLWPYQNVIEEAAAQERMMNNIRQKIEIKKVVTLKPLYIKIAAAAAILISSIIVIYELKNNKEHRNALAFNVIRTKAGEHKILKLSDGTTVWLSAKSQIRYPSLFNGATREVTFEGEAFFSVAKDKKHPFVVHSGVTNTRVLGTTFNITSLSNKPEIILSLLTGKVAFSAGNTMMKLQPGHKIVFNKVKGTVISLDIPNMADIIARRDGDYEYDNVDVADVVEDVNLNFNTNFKVSGKVKTCPFFGRMKPGENPVDFLKKLATIVNAQVVKADNSFTIKGGGCN